MNMDELDKFLRALIAQITGKTVIPQKRDAPKPAKPYLALRFFAYRGFGLDELLPGDDDDTFLVTGERECTCEVHWIGEGAIEGLHGLEQALQSPSVVDRCFGAGVAVYNAEDIQDLSGLLDGVDWESRASMDLQLAVTRQTPDKTMRIADVEITGFADGRTQNISINTSKTGGKT
jgi:hypothetical protein